MLYRFIDFSDFQIQKKKKKYKWGCKIDLKLNTYKEARSRVYRLIIRLITFFLLTIRSLTWIHNTWN